MFANDNKPLGIALLGISKRDRDRLEFFLNRHWPSNRLVMSEERADLCILGPDSVYGQQLLQHQHGYDSGFPLILLSLRGQDFIQLVKLPPLRPASYKEDGKIIVEGALRPDLHRPEKYLENRLQGPINPPIASPHIQTSSLTMNSPSIFYGAAVCQSEAAAYLPTEHSAEVFLLDIGWSGLSTQQFSLGNAQQQPINNVIDFNRNANERRGNPRRKIDRELKQREIENKLLKRALTLVKKQQLELSEHETQPPLVLEQAHVSLKHAEAEGTGSAELKAELAQAQEQLSATEEKLEKTHKLSEEYRQQNIDLQARLQKLQESSEAFRRQSAQDLARLAAERFELECSLHQQEQEQEQHSGDSSIEQMQIAALQQALSKMQAAHKEREQMLRDALNKSNSNAERTIDALNREIGQLHHSQAALELALKESQAQLTQARAGSQEQQNHSLETEKSNTEEQSRSSAVIEDLEAQLEVVRTQVIQQRKKRVKLAAMLQMEHKTARHFQTMMKMTKVETEILSKRLAEAEQTQQELQVELQQEITAAQMAWEKASESDIAMQATKLELTALKKEQEHEIANLRAQLEHLQERSNAAQSQHFEEHEKLQKLLAESQVAQKEAETTISSLRRDRQSLRKDIAIFEEHEAELQARQSELTATIQSSRQEIESLRLELSKTREKMIDPTELNNLRQALRQAEEEKASLKLRIHGLREVQLEMERQLLRDKDREISALRSALDTAEVKLKKAEEQALQTKRLRQKSNRLRNRSDRPMHRGARQVKATAPKRRGKDSHALTRKKGALVRKRERKNKPRSRIRGQYSLT